MIKLPAALVPVSLRGYQRSWLSGDLVAGATLAAAAIAQTMGYTAIARTPIITGLYAIIFPTLMFALLGSSKLLVVGADSATAAILAAGLGHLGIAGLTPYSAKWLAFASLTALVCGGMLALARVFRLGFLGDFLSVAVLVGFLSGVGVQVLTGVIPAMLGLTKTEGNWFSQQWGTIKHLDQVSLTTFAFSAGTVAIIVLFRLYLRKVPGALVAVALGIAVSTATDASAHGVTLVGTVPAGFPPLGLPEGITWGDVPRVLGIAFSCFVLIIAQSAATSHALAMGHGQRVDVNRDIIGLSGANFAAGLSGTFVVNGSPTMSQYLDEQKGRTQLGNITMSAIVLLVVLFAGGVLKDMPQAVLAAIVFLIGVHLIDVRGLRRIYRHRRSEFVIAVITGVTVFVFGVEQGIIVAIIMSILEIVRRQYRPSDFVVRVRSDQGGGAEATTYEAASPGKQSEPGLVVFRFDATLFFANAYRFVDDVQAIIDAAPDPLRWLILDASAIDDVDYSAAISLVGLVDFVHRRGATFALARIDPSLLDALDRLGLLAKISREHCYASLEEAYAAFRKAVRS